MKKCPMCAEEVQDEAIVCKHCRYDFAENKMIGANKITKHDKGIAFASAIILGGIGIHKFYLGKYGQGVFYVLFSWTFIPAIFGIIEGFSYFFMTKEQFSLEYDK